MYLPFCIMLDIVSGEAIRLQVRLLQQESRKAKPAQNPLLRDDR
jgi:hypothetical protein